MRKSTWRIQHPKHIKGKRSKKKTSLHECRAKEIQTNRVGKGSTVIATKTGNCGEL